MALETTVASREIPKIEDRFNVDVTVQSNSPTGNRLEVQATSFGAEVRKVIARKEYEPFIKRPGNKVFVELKPYVEVRFTFEMKWIDGAVHSTPAVRFVDPETNEIVAQAVTSPVGVGGGILPDTSVRGLTAKFFSGGNDERDRALLQDMVIGGLNLPSLYAAMTKLSRRVSELEAQVNPVYVEEQDEDGSEQEQEQEK